MLVLFLLITGQALNRQQACKAVLLFFDEKVRKKKTIFPCQRKTDWNDCCEETFYT